MSIATRDVLELMCGDRLPILRATSPNMGALFPFQAESGLIDPRTGRKLQGIPVGFCGRNRSGGVFYWDEFIAWQAGLIENVNVKRFGAINNHKSGDLKTSIFRGVEYGYNHLVTDLKGEYTALAAAVDGAKVLRFGTDTNLFINPLDGAMSLNTQIQLVTAMALTALGNGRTELNITELTLLRYAIEQAHHANSVALLPHAVDLLFEPSQAVVSKMRRPVDFVKNEGYQLALALDSLGEHGMFGGMFHQPTTPGLLEETPLLVLNCEGLEGAMAVIMITLLNFFTQSQWSGKNPKHRFHKVIHDEAWFLAGFPGFVESVRRGFKLGGTQGTSNTIVAHHKTNLDRSGSGEAVQDLIADSATTILYNQDPVELQRSADELKLNQADVDRIVKLPPGTALYKIGDFPPIEVESFAWPHERKFIETRQRLRGQDDLATAQ
jgi:hypothetical protein